MTMPMARWMRATLLAAIAMAGVVPGVAPAADPVASPADTYAQNCPACHQVDGKGIPGAFPALAGDAFVTGDPAAPVGVVLNGRAGMPTFRDELTDAQIAAALTHARTSWGNKAAPIDAALVAKLRGGVAPVKADPLQMH